MAYKPQLGEMGFFTLISPYDVLLTPKTVYTCQSARTLNDFISSGDSVYDKFYAPLGVSNEDYQRDLIDNVVIVGLQAGTGEWVYVPSSFIAKAPDNTGVKYISVVLGVSLGAIPDEYNLDSVIAQFKDVVKSTLAIDPEVKGVVVGAPKWFTHEEHELIESTRAQEIKTSDSAYVRLAQTKQENEQLKKIIKEYEKIFKMTLTQDTQP